MSIRSVAIVLVALASVTQTTPSQDDWRWLDLSRPEAFNRLLPLAADPGLLVAYRSYRDLYQSEREQYLRIEHRSKAFTATLVVPVGRSIQQQLLDLHRARPAATLEAMLRDMSVRRIVVTSGRCPSLAASIQALSGLNITIPPRDVIVLHPVVHQFVIDVGTLHMDGTLFSEDAPLVQWAERVMRTVAECGAA